LHHSTATLSGYPKLILHFSVAEFGDYFETKLKRYYNVKKLIGKKQKYGNSKGGPRSQFIFDYCRLFPYVQIKRLDRISMSLFDGKTVIGEVRTVESNYKQEKYPKQLHYSVVGKLERVKEI